MKGIISLIVIATVAVVVAEEQQLSRAKRFAGFGTFSTVGGRIGCVVSENGPGNSSLYINSHFTKFLSEEEQQELSQYKDKLAQFKTDVKAFLEQHQQQALAARERFSQSSFPNTNGGGRNARDAAEQSASSSSALASSAAPALKQPEPPKKPSFCSEKATTQYVFDGCSVQGDNVYIGENFVRKLSESEQAELERFDKQFTAYQKAVTNNFKQQVEDIFGKHFGKLFETSSGSNSKGSGDVSAPEQQPSGDNGNTASSPSPPEAPKTPNFCTLIV